jgi:hypothetical protein
MKRLALTLLGSLVIFAITGCGGMRFAKYEGQQKAWPVGSAFSDQVAAVPVFHGWPERQYDLLGYIEFTSPNITWNKGDIEQAAKMAKDMGADAMFMVPKGETSSAKLAEVCQALGLDSSRTRGIALKWK